MQTIFNFPKKIGQFLLLFFFHYVNFVKLKKEYMCDLCSMCSNAFNGLRINFQITYNDIFVVKCHDFDISTKWSYEFHVCYDQTF